MVVFVWYPIDPTLMFVRCRRSPSLIQSSSVVSPCIISSTSNSASYSQDILLTPFVSPSKPGEPLALAPGTPSAIIALFLMADDQRPQLSFSFCLLFRFVRSVNTSYKPLFAEPVPRFVMLVITRHVAVFPAAIMLR